LPTSIALMVHTWRWPGERLVVTAVDAYTGERLVLTRSSGVPLVRAIAASSSVPGLYPPQRLGDRRAMDGGVSGTGIHADLVGGAGRALVLPIVQTLPEARLTVAPDSCEREIDALRETGTLVAVRTSHLPLTTNLMDPAEVPAAVALGERQADEDAAGLAEFWRD
jgi:NTE family protein